MNLQEKIKLRDEMRDAIKMQEEVVDDCSKAFNNYTETSLLLANEADKWELKRDRAKDRLEEMEEEYKKLCHEVYEEGTAKYGTFKEAFNCEKYFSELKAMVDSIPFA